MLDRVYWKVSTHIKGLPPHVGDPGEGLGIGGSHRVEQDQALVLGKQNLSLNARGPINTYIN